MRKNVFGRQFKRDANERKALFKNLLTSLVLEERIRTSEAKAKAIKGAADKLITKAKKGGTAAYRSLEAEVNHNAVVKLIADIAPRFSGRNGGYTRIIKVGKRVADNSSEATIEWVEKPAVTATEGTKETKAPKTQKAQKKEVKKVSSSAKATKDKEATVKVTTEKMKK